MQYVELIAIFLYSLYSDPVITNHLEEARNA